MGYKIIGVIDDTNGQEAAIGMVLEHLREVYEAGYVWSTLTSIMVHLNQVTLNSHMSYIMRVAQERGLVVGVEVRREENNKPMHLWRLAGIRVSQYNSGIIPEDDVIH